MRISAVETHRVVEGKDRDGTDYERRGRGGGCVGEPPDREGQWGVCQTAEVSGERQFGGLLNFSEGEIV